MKADLIYKTAGQAERLTALEQNIPYAVATLERDGGCYLWVVRQCPLCGKKHTHGGGCLSEDPRIYLSHRVAHCAGDAPTGGYFLVEAE